MKIKDLEFDSYGRLVKVSGKTGYRNVRIVSNSIPYLRVGVDSHPFRNAWLFCNMEVHIKGRMIEYQGKEKKDRGHTGKIFCCPWNG